MTIAEFFENNKELIQTANDGLLSVGNFLEISGQLLEMLYPQIIHLDEFKHVKHFEIISDQEFKTLIDAFYEENGAPQINYVPGEDEVDENGIVVKTMKIELSPRFDEYQTYKAGTAIPQYIRVRQISVFMDGLENIFVRLKPLEEVEHPNLDIMRVNTFNPVPPII